MIDILNLADELSPEQTSTQELFRKFLSPKVSEQIVTGARTEKFPIKLIQELGSLGAFGQNLNHASLQGIDSYSYGLIMRELERVDSALRSFASVQGALVMFPIFKYGSQEQQDKWLKDLASGKKIGAFALTESHGGSDPGAMKTTVKLEDDQWILNGSKTWITNGTFADVIVVWARTEKGVQGFLVPGDTPGIKKHKMENKLSLRASETAELFFEDVKLPKSAILAEAQGLKAALSCLSEARYGIAWGVLGAAEACYQEAYQFASERILFKRPLTHTQLAQKKFAEMARDIQLAQLLAMQLAKIKDQNKLTFAQISMGKQNNVATALRVARTCRDILGAYGVMDEFHTMRHMCNLETVSTYEGTNDVHLLIMGQQITGHAAFS